MARYEQETETQDPRIAERGHPDHPDRTGAGHDGGAHGAFHADAVPGRGCAAHSGHGLFHAGCGHGHDAHRRAGGHTAHALKKAVAHRCGLLCYRRDHHRGRAGPAGTGPPDARGAGPRAHLHGGRRRGVLPGGVVPAHPVRMEPFVAAHRLLHCGIRSGGVRARRVPSIPAA